MTRKLVSTNGEVAFVEDIDYEFLNQITWYAANGYFVCAHRGTLNVR